MLTDWFGTHRKASLRKAGGWAFGQNAFKAMFQFVSAVILARLLSPEAFGTFAVMMAFHSIITPLIGQTFSTSLIQRKDLSEQEASNFFWLTFALASGFGVLLIAAGPVIAWFFDDPIYVWMAPVFAILLVLDAIGAQYQAIVMRSLRYDILFRIQIFSMVPAIVGGVLAALGGLGTWALVINMLLASALLRIFIMRSTGWLPKRYSRSTPIREMVSFSARMTFAALTRVFYDRLPVFFLAKLSGMPAVGYYNRGDALFRRPFEQATYPIVSLFLPSMSAASKDMPRMQALLTQGAWLLALAIGPLLAFMMVYGDRVALVLLGEQWREAGDVLRWMALMAVGLIYRRPLDAVNAAIGRPARCAMLKLVLLPVFAGVIYLVASNGAGYTTMIMAVFYMAMLPVEIFILLRGLPLAKRPILVVQAASLGLMVLTGGLLYWLRVVLASFDSLQSTGVVGLASLTLFLIIGYAITLAFSMVSPDARAVVFRLFRRGKPSAKPDVGSAAAATSIEGT